MSLATERSAMRRQTDWFIRAQPLELSLTRPTMARTAAGGIVEAGSIIVPPQIFRWMPFKRRLTIEKVLSPQTRGREYLTKVPYILIGYWDADIQDGDRFTTPPVSHGLAHGQYEVLFVSAWEEYRSQAGIIYRGPKGDGG